MNLCNVFQLEQAFIVFKGNAGEKLGRKRSPHACVARRLRKEAGDVRRAALAAVGPSRGLRPQYPRGVSPSQTSGVRGDLCLLLAGTCRAERQILPPTLSWRRKNYPLQQGNVPFKCLIN